MPPRWCLVASRRASLHDRSLADVIRGKRVMPLTSSSVDNESNKESHMSNGKRLVVKSGVNVAGWPLNHNSKQLVVKTGASVAGWPLNHNGKQLVVKTGASVAGWPLNHNGKRLVVR